MTSERLNASLHMHDRETIRRYQEEIVPLMERRIKQLESQLEERDALISDLFDKAKRTRGGF